MADKVFAKPTAKEVEELEQVEKPQPKVEAPVIESVELIETTIPGFRNSMTGKTYTTHEAIREIFNIVLKLERSLL